MRRIAIALGTGLSLCVVATSANATFIGDGVHVAASGSQAPTFSPDTATVGAGVEFFDQTFRELFPTVPFLTVGSLDTWEIDLSASAIGFSFSYDLQNIDPGATGGTGFNSVALVLSDLDWLRSLPREEIVGVSVSGTGFALDGFTGDSITVSRVPFSVSYDDSGASGTVSALFSVTTAVVPEPSTAALLAVGLVLLTARRRKTR